VAHIAAPELLEFIESLDFRVQSHALLKGPAEAGPSGNRPGKPVAAERQALAAEVTARIGEEFADYIGLHVKSHCMIYS
jgi:hypothetical protein